MCACARCGRGRPPAPRVGHQVLAVRLNKKKCQRSAPGGCAGSSPLPAAPRSEHPASDSQQHPLESSPELPSSLPTLHGTALPHWGLLSAVTHPCCPKARMVTLGGWVLCLVQRVLEHTLESALTSCQIGASPCKLPLYLKTDQQGHLLDSHVQLMADAACCLLSPPL